MSRNKYHFLISARVRISAPGKRSWTPRQGVPIRNNPALLQKAILFINISSKTADGLLTECIFSFCQGLSNRRFSNMALRLQCTAKVTLKLRANRTPSAAIPSPCMSRAQISRGTFSFSSEPFYCCACSVHNPRADFFAPAPNLFIGHAGSSFVYIAINHKRTRLL